MTRQFQAFQFTASGDGGWDFTCQHGPNECEGNLYQACVIDKIDDPDTEIEVISCIMSDSEPYTATQKVISTKILFFKFLILNSAWAKTTSWIRVTPRSIRVTRPMRAKIFCTISALRRKLSNRLSRGFPGSWSTTPTLRRISGICKTISSLRYAQSIWAAFPNAVRDPAAGCKHAF